MAAAPSLEVVPIKIFNETRCELGEGCGYDRGTNTVWWFDILARRLFEVQFGSDLVHSQRLPIMASAGAFIDNRRQLIAADDGIYVRNRSTGHLVRVKDLEADIPGNRSNDGRAHRCGAFWIGTMGRNAERGAGAIYHFHAGELRQLYSGITIPNAICFSPDGTTAYFADTSKNILSRVAIDPSTALPKGEPQLLYDHRDGVGGLDGAVVDAEGLIWNARWGAGCVDAYTPAGERVRTVRIPATRPSCPVFAGPDLDALIVTSAWEGMDEAAKNADPGHGQTFLLELSVRGSPEARVNRLGADS
jgi:sugar lactone lactonase